MAYGKKYYTSFKSYNSWDYYMEIWEKDFVGSDSEIILGAGGPIISYDTDSEDRDNTILASTLSIPFIVENAAQETFIDNLRDLYEEQDIYVHLYQSTSANEDPLWSGFVLMDLGTKEDVVYPFEVKLTATDGISLLKDRDFIVDGATRPYSSTDVYWGPANFTYWIARILEKVGAGSTDNGAYSNAEFSTSVNWYNQEHDSDGQADDPLRLTQGKVSWTHSVDDNGNYSVLNCYDVLKEIMKVWHCRITYWNHSFYIVQIPEYNTVETGTNLNPVNVNARIYTLTGAASSNQAYLGNKYNTRYFLLFGQNIQGGIQKLVGTKYQFYPRLKSTSAGYITGGGTNYYNGFPTYDGTTLTSPALQQTVIDAASATNIFLAIPLNVSQTGIGDISFRMFFQVKATNGTTTRWLKFQNNTYSWNATQPATSPTFYGPRWKGIISGNNAQVVLGFSETLPSDPLFTGAWDFEIQMDNSEWGMSSIYSFWAAPLGQTPVTWYSTPTSLGITWTNVTSLSQNTSASSPFDGQLLLLNSSAGVNISGQNVIIETSYTDSDNFDFGELRWGDSQSATDPGNLTVWDGAAWVQTDFAGEWGDGTLTGVVNFTNLMLTEYMSGQATNIQIINARLMTSEVGKDSDDGTLTVPNYVNPIGILRESVPGADNTYVFRRGAFQLTTDEWDYEGWVIKDRTETTTITTTNTWGPNGPVADDNGTMGFMIGNPNTGSNAAATNAFITRSSDDITGTVTRINIVPIDMQLLQTGDKVLLIDKFNRMFALEINAEQSSGDEYLTIVSYDFGDDIIPIGALLTHNEVNLIEQYQRKSEGTVAGFDVDATTLTKGGIGIDGFLDSDTMTGASATTLPTSESVKAYVDGQAGHDETLQQVTDNGNTTTNDITFNGGTSTGNFEVNKGSAAIAVVEVGGANLKMVAGGATGYVGTYNNTNLTFVSNSSEKMRITSAGNVGIGTTAPDDKLHVSGGNIRLTAAAATEAILSLHPNNGNAVDKWQISAASDGSNLSFSNKSSGSMDSVMYLKDTGNVGIGTDSPSSYAGTADNLVVNGGAADSGITIATTSSYIGNLYFADGTTGAEKYAGLIQYQHSTDMMKFGTGGITNRMVIDSSGNVGIGTTSPSSILEVGNNTGSYAITINKNTAGTGTLYFDNDGNHKVYIQADSGEHLRIGVNNTEKLCILESGNVGIGTTSPDAKLHVYKGSAGTYTPSTLADAVVVENSNSSGLTIVTPDNKTSALFFGSPSRQIGVRIQWNHDSDLFSIGTAKAGAEMAIKSGNESEAMRITSAGDVGIGTTAPAQKLEIQGTVRINDGAGNHHKIFLGNTDNWIDEGLRIATTSDGDAFIRLEQNSKKLTLSGDNLDSGGRIILYGRNGGDAVHLSTGSGGIYLNGSGDCGIGTTTPSAKLEVVGTGKFSDQVTIPATPVATTDAASKSYVDAQVGVTNYEQFKCSGTSTTSDTDGEGAAVVIKYDTSIIASSTNTIIAVGSGGAGGSEGSEYCFYSTTQGQFELQWNLGTNTNIVNNRLLTGVKLQTGTIVEEVMVWVDVDTTHSYIYNRGSGGVRQGSTTNQTILESKITLVQQYWRVVFWKEESTDASTTAISLLNASSIIIKQLS